MSLYWKHNLLQTKDAIKVQSAMFEHCREEKEIQIYTLFENLKRLFPSENVSMTLFDQVKVCDKNNLTLCEIRWRD